LISSLTEIHPPHLLGPPPIIRHSRVITIRTLTIQIQADNIPNTVSVNLQQLDIIS